MSWVIALLSSVTQTLRLFLHDFIAANNIPWQTWICPSVQKHKWKREMSGRGRRALVSSVWGESGGGARPLPVAAAIVVFVHGMCRATHTAARVPCALVSRYPLERHHWNHSCPAGPMHVIEEAERVNICSYVLAQAWSMSSAKWSLAFCTTNSWS